MGYSKENPHLLTQHEDRLLIDLFTLEAVPTFIHEVNAWGLASVGFDWSNPDPQKNRGVMFIAPANEGAEDISIPEGANPEDFITRPANFPKRLGTSFGKVMVYLLHLFNGVNDSRILDNRAGRKKDGEAGGTINRTVSFTLKQFSEVTGMAPNRAREALETALSVISGYDMHWCEVIDRKAGICESKCGRIGDYKKEKRNGRTGSTYSFTFRDGFLDYLKRAGTKPIRLPLSIMRISEHKSPYAFRLGIYIHHDLRNRGHNIKGAGKLSLETITRRLPFPKPPQAETNHGFRTKQMYLVPLVKALDALKEAEAIPAFTVQRRSQDITEAGIYGIKYDEFKNVCIHCEVEKK